MPAMGANPNGRVSVTVPIWVCPGSAIDASIGPDIGRLDVDADRLTDQVDRQHETGVCALTDQPPDDPCQRPVHDLDQHALVDERTRVVLELALDQADERAPISSSGIDARTPSNDTMLTTPEHFSTVSR